MSPSATSPRPPATGVSIAEYAGVLHANSSAHEWLAGRALLASRREDPESILNRVASAAYFAANFHPGRFADGTIENLAWEIGTGLKGSASDQGEHRDGLVAAGSRRRVLHVATQVYGIGGHTRMLHRWIESDRHSCHSLALVNQAHIAVPRWLSEAVQRSGGELRQLPQGSSVLERGRQLRKLARHGADLVVLHHHPHDVVPSVAFSDADGPPVALLNHADHLFWLGGTIADLTINLRSSAADISAARRSARSNAVLPIPLRDEIGTLSRHDARMALGIPHDQLVLLSVGREEKYQPCGPFNFVATARRILDRQPNAHLYVVGASTAGIARSSRGDVHDRLHLVGAMEDPSRYRAAADVYLESFPFGSNTALLEAALAGLPVVPAYAPLFPLIVADNDSLRDLLTNPPSEQEYIARAESMIRQPDERIHIGQILRERVLTDHVGDGWLRRLAAVYDETDGLTHRAGPLPATSCEATDGDIGLSMRNVFANGRTKALELSGATVLTALRHGVFVSRHVGDYASGRRFAAHAFWHAPRTRASWRLLAVSLLGRAALFISALRRRR